jgi:hypothetical protein
LRGKLLVLKPRRIGEGPNKNEDQLGPYLERDAASALGKREVLFSGLLSIFSRFSAVCFYPDRLAEADLSFVNTERKPASRIVAGPGLERNIISLWPVVR